MYSIHNCDDLEKTEKQLQETRSLIHKQILKEKLGKQDFHTIWTFSNLLLENRTKTKLINKYFPKGKNKRYVILLKLLNAIQDGTRANNTAVIF